MLLWGQQLRVNQETKEREAYLVNEIMDDKRLSYLLREMDKLRSSIVDIENKHLDEWYESMGEDL